MPMTTTTTFVPAELNATKWENLEPLYAALTGRVLKCQGCLEGLILDRSELDAAVSEAQANLYIETTRHTEDTDVREAYEAFVTNVEPKLKTVSFELDTKIATSEHAANLDQERYGMLLTHLKTDIEMFREANVPIETELSLLEQKYAQLSGAMTVEFDGEEKTLPMMARYLEVTDRSVRETAWRTTWDRRLQDRQAFDDLFDEMVAKRVTIAANTGYPDYRDYAHDAKHRYDYKPEDCMKFHEAVEKHCVPVMRRLNAERTTELGVDALRPWDLGVDTKGRQPLRPFENAEEMFSGSSRMFHRMDARLGAMFDSLKEGDCLDLETRKAKAPGGYQYQRERSRQPFIFMNAAGVHRDVETMVHEAGHAFHSIVCKDEPIMAYRSAPMEFCEVASMSMELLTFPYLNEFYSEEDANRAKRDQLEGMATMLPWIATIDCFQHWIYTNPGHTAADRTQAWLDVTDRFGAAIDWTGVEAMREASWQRQLHIFGLPFYYIEYGIAQLGALQVWLNTLHDETEGIAKYLAALELGGKAGLPVLFETAGGTFDFGDETIGPLMERVSVELEKLPA